MRKIEEFDISLTEKGMQIAVSIAERHEILSKVLMMLGVPEETAYNDACKIEHDISEESFEAIKRYAEGKQKRKLKHRNF